MANSDTDYTQTRVYQGTLYMVATPIGHLDDLSQRAVHVLKSVQTLAAEDTRRTRVLLDHIQHRVPNLVSLHEHNEADMAQRLLRRLQEGEDVAVVSDAGTPLVNDPGFVLVGMAHAAGIRVVPIPGASALTSLLSVCPLPAQPFRFVGFLPPKEGARHAALSADLARPDALVFLEAPHRIRDTLGDLSQLTARRVMLGRELTKKYETLMIGTADELLQQLDSSPRGEFIGLVEASREASVPYAAQQVLQALLAELAPTRAAKVAAAICGGKRSDYYELAVQLKPPER